LFGGYGEHGYYGYGGSGSGSHGPVGINYDYTCTAAKDEACLQNDITLYGPKVVLVNLDNRCQVEKLEH